MKAIFFFIFFFESLALVMPNSARAQYDDANWRSYFRESIAKGRILEALREAEIEAGAEEKAGRWNRAAVMYDEAAKAALRNGQLQKALTYGQKTLDASEQSNDPWLRSLGIARMVDALQYLGKSRDAREWIQKGLDNVGRIEVGVWREAAAATFNSYMGRDFLRTNELDKAIDHLSYAVQLRESIVSFNQRSGAAQYVRLNQDVLIWEFQGLGVAYQRAKAFDKAIETFEKALQIIERTNLQTARTGDIYDNLARVYLQVKDPVRAEGYFVKAFEFGSKLQLSPRLISTAIQLGNLSLQKEEPTAAIEYYKKAIGSIESSRSQIQSEELRKSYFANQTAAYTGIVRASVAANKTENSFDYNERARSRAFLDLLGTRVQLSRDQDLAREEKALRERITALSQRPSGQRESEESEPVVVTQQRRELAAAQKAYDSFVAKLKKENNEQASLMNVDPLTVKQVQQMLDPGVTVLEYFVTPQEIFLWVVDKEEAQAFRIAQRRGALLKRVNGFREAVSQLEDERTLKKQGRGLFNLLVQPALSHIKGKELIIVPHDVLHYLPFQALLAPDGQYLIEKYPISYLSSASLMQFTQEKRKARGELSSILGQGGKVLTFGNPDLGDPKMSLAFAGIEAKEIKSLYPQSTIYLEKDATEEKAKALVGDSDIIHFASHAELNENDPLSSAVLLAKSDKEDGRLEVREIFGMDLKASLVVLSACETGLGKLSSGDELVGLTRAFIYAGTPSVVASLWNVEDSSTAQLMASFYKNLKTMTKVEALRQAQLSLIRGNVNSDLLARRGIGGVGKLGDTPSAEHSAPSATSVSTSHPYFWAPFILVGEGK